MSACRFTISSTNPNEQIGGGGCACSPLKNPDQRGPFAVFPATETESNLSPHLVVCAPCAAAIVTQSDGEALLLGEADIIEVE